MDEKEQTFREFMREKIHCEDYMTPAGMVPIFRSRWHVLGHWLLWMVMKIALAGLVAVIFWLLVTKKPNLPAALPAAALTEGEGKAQT